LKLEATSIEDEMRELVHVIWVCATNPMNG